MSNGSAPGTLVGSVVKAVAILRHIADMPGPSGVNAIARAVDVSPSTCFNILRTLVHEGLVELDPHTKAYSFGAAAIALLQRTADSGAAFPLASPLLEDLADRYGATTALWRLTASERLVLLGFAEAASFTRIHMTVGLRLPMLAGAGGRCVAAKLNLSQQAMAREFKKLRWQKAPGFQEYCQQVAEARERGWAIDDGAFLLGVTTVAAAVTNHDGSPHHIVTATVFREQHSPEALAKIGEDLTRCSVKIASRIGSNS